jgi:hypothetical protein
MQLLYCQEELFYNIHVDIKFSAKILVLICYENVFKLIVGIYCLPDLISECGIIPKSRPTGQWFSLGTPVSPGNKTDRRDITDGSIKGYHYNIAALHPVASERLSIMISERPTLFVSALLFKDV